MVPLIRRLPGSPVPLAVLSLACLLVTAVTGKAAMPQVLKDEAVSDSPIAGDLVPYASWLNAQDTIPPLPPTLISPADGSKTNSSKQTFAWSTPADSGGSGIKNYRIYIDDEPTFAAPRVKEYTAAGLSYSPTLYQGHFYWRIYARDNAGNQSEWSACRELIIDQTAPLSACSAVTLTNRSPIAVEWEAGDAGGGGVAWTKLYHRYGAQPGWIRSTQDSTAGLSGVFDFIPSPGDGIYYFKTISVDSAGNSEAGPAGCGNDSTLLDTRPPSVPVLLRPEQGSWTADTTIGCAWTCASDPVPASGVRQYHILIDNDSSVTAPYIRCDSTADTSAAYSIAEGSICWKISAQDMAGNSSAWTEVGHFGIDRTPPQILYHDPPPGGSTVWFGSQPGPVIDIDFQAGSGSPLCQAAYYVPSQQEWYPIFEDLFMTAYVPGWTCVWADMAEGEEPITMAVSDAAGNRSLHSYLPGISGFLFRKDVTAPDVICPAEATFRSNGEACNVSDIVLKEATARDSLDPCPVVVNNAPQTFPAGTTWVTWTATDHAGNRADCVQQVTVTEQVPPTLTFTEPSTECMNHPPCYGDLCFADNCGLDAGWYRIDQGLWVPLFSKCDGRLWTQQAWCLSESLFMALRDGHHTIYFKAVDDEENAGGQFGEWDSPFRKDLAPPAGPLKVSSPSHVPGTWSNDPHAILTWTDGRDGEGGCGLSGYSVLWSYGPEDIPAADTGLYFIPAGIAEAKQLLSDGIHYAHLRGVDQAGNWQAEAGVAHYGPFCIDITRPACTIARYPINGVAICDMVDICFAGVDNHTPEDSLVFSYLLVGVDPAPSAWSRCACATYKMPAGTHLFWVWAQDLAGNRSHSAECMVDASSAYCLKGDVNADCHIDILDVARCTAIILGTVRSVSAADSCRADGWEDGLVNVLDALWIVNGILEIDRPGRPASRSGQQE